MASTNESTVRFAADAPPELAEFADCLETIHRDHTVSYVLAGTDRIYAYGAHGYTVVISERVFEGLVELMTPFGALRIEPDASGLVAATPASESQTRTPSDLLGLATRELTNYYLRRYWKV